MEIAFKASSVETYKEYNVVLITHFDNECDHYLQIQGNEGYKEDISIGYTYVEIDDQGISSYDNFSVVELDRNHIKIEFLESKKMGDISSVYVTFDVNDEEYKVLVAYLTKSFRFNNELHVTT